MSCEIRDSNETPFSCWKHWSVRLQLAVRVENVLFWPRNLDIWGQKSIFCLVIAIFVDGTNDHYTRGYNFPIGTTPKKFSVSELGVIFWGSPLFLAVFGHWRVRGATTLNFGLISTKLGGTVRATVGAPSASNSPSALSAQALRKKKFFFCFPKFAVQFGAEQLQIYLQI